MKGRPQMKKPLFPIVGFIARYLAFGFVLLLTASVFLQFPFAGATRTVSTDAGALPSPALILDAGHGGMDCGAVGIGGILEKDLNLELSGRLAALLTANGIPVLQTRQEDKMLDEENPSLSGTHKLRDLRNRLELARQNPSAVFVSLHMNKFPQASSRGLQVWYSRGTPGSETLAKEVQSRVTALLQPDNHRACKAAISAVYLLHRAPGDAILIECGFLSNPEEAALLQDDGYQQKLTSVLFSVLCDYLCAESTPGTTAG